MLIKFPVNFTGIFKFVLLPPNEYLVHVFGLVMWRRGPTWRRTSPTDWCCFRRSIHGDDDDDAKMSGKCAKRVPVVPVPVQNELPNRKIAEWCRKRDSTTDPVETSSGLTSNKLKTISVMKIFTARWPHDTKNCKIETKNSQSKPSEHTHG